MQKALLILLILCSQGVWIPILDTCIEYPDMARLHIMKHNVIKTYVNHHVGPYVDEYGLITGCVTLQTWPMTTLDMLVVLPINFRGYDDNIFDVTRQSTCPRTLVNGFTYRLCYKYDFPYLMVELVHMYDVWNEPVLDQNISLSIQNWSIFWPSSSYDWWQYNFLINRTIAM